MTIKEAIDLLDEGAKQTGKSRINKALTIGEACNLIKRAVQTSPCDPIPHWLEIRVKQVTTNRKRVA